MSAMDSTPQGPISLPSAVRAGLMMDTRVYHWRAQDMSNANDKRQTHTLESLRAFAHAAKQNATMAIA